ADQARLLTASRRAADGAALLAADLLEAAHGPHHHRPAGAVVGCAGAGVPGVHVRAEHHHFIGLGAAARDLGDGVVAVAVLVGGEARIHVHAQTHGLAVVERADHLVVVLGDHAQLGHADRLAGLARAAAGGTHDAVVAVADAEGSQHALLDQELA